MTFPLKRLLAFMPGGILATYSQIVIDDEDKNRLVLIADGWPTIFDKPTQLVFYSGRPAATFSSIESIDVAHFINGKRVEWWTLSLSLRGGRKLAVGRSIDGVEASIAAAHAATITGKKVRAFERVGF
ncbi:hypothetical protein [Undibacterium terreum]|uniref:Uncharacterized protein n=1 Tax=Undibacterium terreum TaxID=1224302 RepID=A0A916ULD1_9BURK|nr:hypothetical protein [Undibacterium terreum]GGC77335.1 hypothetical protein GCM10011396_25600 [Undibacterium terreum]